MSKVLSCTTHIIQADLLIKLSSITRINNLQIGMGILGILFTLRIFIESRVRLLDSNIMISLNMLSIGLIIFQIDLMGTYMFEIVSVLTISILTCLINMFKYIRH